MDMFVSRRRLHATEGEKGHHATEGTFSMSDRDSRNVFSHHQWAFTKAFSGSEGLGRTQSLRVSASYQLLARRKAKRIFGSYANVNHTVESDVTGSLRTWGLYP
jgi:hypothetical protein